MQSSSINFGSGIKIVKEADFLKEMSQLHPVKSVDYPWTANQIIKAQKVVTRGIEDCTAGVITSGQDAVMFHICPTVEKNKDFNKDFNKIESTILNLIGGKASELQGFLIGGNGLVKNSMEVFEMFENFFENKLKIPYTKFKEHSLAGESSLIFNSTKDEYILWNDFVERSNFFEGKEKFLKTSYYDMKISDLDEIV